MKFIQNLKVGADPEVFFVDAKTNQPKSAEGMLGGDKNHPVPMKDLPAGFFVQEDNVTCEFNIPPAAAAGEFQANIFKSIAYIRKIARANKCRLALLPDLDFDPAQLATKHCQRLGCDPDSNIWTMEENPPPVAPPNMRTAAGHVHVGWDTPNLDQAKMVGRGFDLFLTVPSILATQKNRRRELYGKAGAVRLKPYGIECRSLDNFWLGSKENTFRVFDNVTRLVWTINNRNDLLGEFLEDYKDMIIECINSHRQEEAKFLISKFDIPEFKPHAA